MKLLLTFLVASVFAALDGQSQNQPVTKSTSTTSTTTRSSVRPPATQASPTASSPNRQQELYDQYHGVTRKPSPMASPAAPAETQASRPASQPTPVASADMAERPVSSADANMSAVRIGVRGGLTRLIYLEDAAGLEPKPAFVGGFVFNIGRGVLSFQTELNYARYAANSTIGQGTLSELVFKQAVDRFEVPLFLKVASGTVNSTRFFLNIGPYGAYVSSASINSQKVPLDNSTGRFSFGAAAGVGAALKAGPGHVTIEVRGLYELGNTDNTISTDSRVISAQATLGYMIPLGGR